MQDIIDSLRELGVYIPEHLDEAQLLNLAKKLNPWTVSVHEEEGGFRASTRSSGDSGMGLSPTAAQAALELLLAQLKAGRYSVSDTNYKQNAMSYRAVNP